MVEPHGPDEAEREAPGADQHLSTGPPIHGPIIARRDANIAAQQTIIYTAAEHQRRLGDYLALLRRLGEGEQARALLASAPPLTAGLPLDRLRLVVARAALRWKPPLPDPAAPLDELTRRTLVAELLLPLVTQPQLLLAPPAYRALVALSSREVAALARREGRAYLGRLAAPGPAELLDAHQSLALALADPQYAAGCARLLADLAGSEPGQLALAVALRERERAPEAQGAPVPPALHLLAAGAVGGAAGGGLVVAVLGLLRDARAGGEVVPPGDGGAVAPAEAPREAGDGQGAAPGGEAPAPAEPHSEPARARADWRIPVDHNEWRAELERRNERFGAPDGYWCYVRPGTYRSRSPTESGKTERPTWRPAPPAQRPAARSILPGRSGSGRPAAMRPTPDGPTGSRKTLQQIAGACHREEARTQVVARLFAAGRGSGSTRTTGTTTSVFG